ncbi:AfsR/SARP family transcriptional regulator [Truepera radiovictrix]|uniref:AfsR/SARP family transcriptional regulator n=1 Tax=Truepera radiovictrix TaxID=332249 RepID=UPI0005A55BD4|nr:bacterial transcriptional activator domain-containing protein [Truepera radiovictrix]WMT57785.1 bacterial transcriptional activator domain-containing protein [Truepera radiovictrix]
MGAPRLRCGAETCDLDASRPSLLLFYLALQPGWLRRDELAFFLRPDVDRETGLQYLRKLLSSARRLPWAVGLDVEAERVRWRVDTDVARFWRAHGEGRWFEALELYRGPLLQGIETPFSPGLETWLESEREALEHAWAGATLHYAADQEASGHYREAAAAARRLLERDPFNEDALGSFVRNAYLMGQREVALRAAQAFEERLTREFGLALTPTLRTLVDDVRAGRPLQQRAAAPRYGRRRSDRTGVERSKQALLGELVQLLATPDSRLLSISSPERGGVTLLLAKRVPDTQVALLAVLDLAAKLLAEGRRARALGLLLIVLDHPSCSAALREQVQALWPGLEAQLRPN